MFTNNSNDLYDNDDSNDGKQLPNLQEEKDNDDEVVVAVENESAPVAQNSERQKNIYPPKSAMSKGNKDKVKRAIHFQAQDEKENEIKIDVRPAQFDLADKTNTSLHLAAYNNDSDALRKLSQDKKLLLQTNSANLQALDVAIQIQNDDAAKVLFAAQNPENPQANIFTALQSALERNQLRTIQWILKTFRMDATAKDKMDNTLLHYAAKTLCANAIIDFLISEGAGNAVNKFRKSVVDTVYDNNLVGTYILKSLILKGKLSSNDKLSNGQTLLNAAVLRGNTEFVAFLVEQNAIPSMEDYFSAISLGHGEVLQRLISTNTNLKDLLQWTLQQANNPKLKDQQKKEYASIIYILQHAVKQQDKNALPALHIAAGQNFQYTVSAMLQHPSLLKYVNVCDVNGMTALDHAATNGHLDTFKTLYSRAGRWTKKLGYVMAGQAGRDADFAEFADVQKAIDTAAHPTDEEKLLLHVAAKRGNLSAVKSLVTEPNRDVNYLARSGRASEARTAALHQAVLYNRKEVVEWMIEHGNAKLHVFDQSGNTPYALAESKGFEHISALFQKKQKQLPEVIKPVNEPELKREGEAKEGEFEIITEYPNVPLNPTEPMYAYACITMPAAPAVRPGKNVAWLVDISGSMQGTKLELVKTTLLSYVDLLGPQDTATLIQFDDKSTVLQSGVVMDEKGKAKLIPSINALRINGGTNIIAALTDLVKVSTQIYKNGGPNATAVQATLFTDGQHESNGVLDNPTIKAILKGSENALQIHTFGIGPDNKPKELNLIANLGHGSYLAIPSAKDIEAYAYTRIGHIININVDKLPIHMKANKRTAGFSIEEKDLDNQHDGKMALYGLAAEQRKYILFKIQAPASDSAEKIPLLSASINGVDYDLNIWSSENPVRAANPKVVAQRLRLQTAEVEQQAAEMLNKEARLKHFKEFEQKLINEVEALPALAKEPFFKECMRRITFDIMNFANEAARHTLAASSASLSSQVPTHSSATGFGIDDDDVFTSGPASRSSATLTSSSHSRQYRQYNTGHSMQSNDARLPRPFGGPSLFNPNHVSASSQAGPTPPGGPSLYRPRPAAVQAPGGPAVSSTTTSGNTSMSNTK